METKDKTGQPQNGNKPPCKNKAKNKPKNKAKNMKKNDKVKHPGAKQNPTNGNPVRQCDAEQNVSSICQPCGDDKIISVDGYGGDEDESIQEEPTSDEFVEHGWWDSSRHRHYTEFIPSTDEKIYSLLNLIVDVYPHVPLIVFVESQQRADSLVCVMREKNFLPANTIAENESPSQVLAKIHLFRTLNRPILVLTDAVARDLRLPQVAQVVHCDLPRDIAVFEQRNALVARCGVVMTLIDDRGRDPAHMLRDLVQLLEEYEQLVPPPLQDMVFLAVHGFPKHLVEEKGFQPAGDEALHFCLMDDALLNDFSALTMK